MHCCVAQNNDTDVQLGLIPGGVAYAMKVTLATRTATMPMAGMPILNACFEVKPAHALQQIKPQMIVNVLLMQKCALCMQDCC